MQTDALVPVSWRSKPRSFLALMSLYESNFLRLKGLCGDTSRLVGERVSRVADDCDLLLTITEQTPYTTGMNLTYLLPDDTAAGGVPGMLRFPDMEIRIYSDARVAEARGWSPQLRHPALLEMRQGLVRTLDLRWAMNIMLNKWLEYCLERGHRFT
ncbi:MAG: hypothetical protein RLZZ200_2739 [Pseudomonadota bacterium]|jgi:uncharacterized protein YqiB (DUF1249 family)